MPFQKQLGINESVITLVMFLLKNKELEIVQDIDAGREVTHCGKTRGENIQALNRMKHSLAK